MTAKKRTAILKFYESTAQNLYQGFARRMAGYAKSPVAERNRVADLFQQAQAL